LTQRSRKKDNLKCALKTTTTLALRPRKSAAFIINGGTGAGFPSCLPHSLRPKPTTIPSTSTTKGFVSFHTGDLGSSATVLDAKLRLYQATSGSNLTPSTPCDVDIIKGSFNGHAALEGQDYTAAATATNAFSVTNVGEGNWFEGYIPNSLASSYVSTSSDSNGGHTQFRIYFPGGAPSGHYEAWNSGEGASTGTAPYLIVQFR
jgi:hypothetical protein